jgi:hypothetical protein
LWFQGFLILCPFSCYGVSPVRDDSVVDSR